MASRARSDDVELCQYCVAVVEHTEDESAGGDTASSMDPVEDDAPTSRASAADVEAYAGMVRRRPSL